MDSSRSAADGLSAGSPEISPRRHAAAPSPRYVLLACGAMACIAVDGTLVGADSSSTSWLSAWNAVYLSLLSVALSVPRIELPRGYLTLSAIALNATSLLLTPRLAAVVGLTTGIAVALLHRRVASVRLLQVVTLTTGPICAAATRTHVPDPLSPWTSEAAGLVVATAAPLALTGLLGSALSNETPRSIITRNLSRHWVGAFIYFAVAGLLIAHVIDSSLSGYVLATLVAVLALALSDSVAGRQVRLRLQAQLSDAERVVAYSRVVEGTIHNLRNHLAAASGHLDEMLVPSAELDRGRHLLVAGAAVSDAVELLDQLQAGNAGPPQTSVVDLVSICSDACTLLRGRADKKRVTLSTQALDTSVLVRTDALIVKQILANLLINGIDAVGIGGVVTTRVVRAGSLVSITVADTGPGVPEKYRDRLFEPHFTTKSDGNGIGLYVSYQLARSLGGDLSYRGGEHGAVFTLSFPAPD